MDKQAVEFNAEYRDTSRGAFDQTRLFSFRQQRELKPHKAERSKTGRHGTDTWYLLPGRYPRHIASYSNSGKGGTELDVLVVNADGTTTSDKLNGDAPAWLIEIVGTVEPYD